MGFKSIAITAAVASCVGYMGFWPVDIDPEGWSPPAFVELKPEARYSLADVKRWVPGAGVGPEGVSCDEQGRVYAGYADGRIVRVSSDGARVDVLAETGGRPWGTHVSPSGETVLVADAIKGLLEVKLGQVRVLATQANGTPFKLTDDVIQAQDGAIYFTDASSKFGIDKMMADVFEHGANGRLMRYDTKTGAVDVLISGLHVANGVALGPDDAYLLVAETLSYKVWKYWLKGPKAGSKEVFVENLPGFPDNISFNGKDGFWLALFAPRDPVLDALLPHPALLKIAYRIPTFLQPKPKKVAHVLKYDLNGQLKVEMKDDQDGAYAPVTSARECNGALMLGSIEYPAVGQVSIPK